MATYKVIQDIEAEDKLIGPLTLRQFIYAMIAAASVYLSVMSVTKNVPFLLIVFAPVAGVMGFFAFPWAQDQPTEVWALAKVRFLFKPRKRLWDQSGVKELVTITVPKHIERALTNGLSQGQVRSRLAALASTIDSRGWAVKNVNVDLGANNFAVPTSDRLVQGSSLPQAVSNVDVRASDDIMDPANNPIAQQFDSMITAASAAHRQQLMTQMQQPAVSTPVPMPALVGTPAAAAPRPMPQQSQQQGQPADYWFMHPAATVPGQATFVDTPVITPGVQASSATPAPLAATPTAEEEAMVAKFRQENSSQSVAYGHMKTLKTPEQLAEEQAAQAAAAAQAAKTAAANPPVTPAAQAVILDLSNNDDLDVATLARQAHKAEAEQNDGEVVISLR